MSDSTAVQGDTDPVITAEIGPRVVLLPADETGCGQYRMIYPGRHLAAQGHLVSLNMPMARNTWPVDINIIEGRPDLPRRMRPVVGVKPIDADVVMFQRPNSRRLYDTIGFIQEQGVAVIVDIDDAIWNVHHRNVAAQSWNADKDHNWRWALKCARRADLFTATTQALIDKVGDGMVIRNFIPDRYIVDKAKDKARSVGWAGTIATHPDDLQVTRGRIAETIHNNPGIEFVALGGGPNELRALGFTLDDIRDNQLIHGTGPIPFDYWMPKMKTLDVSLVPLSDSTFNEAKSDLKMLESAAVGAACVASPTPANLRASAVHNYGLIANSHAQWGKYVERLIVSQDLFTEQSQRGIDFAESRSLSRNAWRWAEAYQQALDNRRKS